MSLIGHRYVILKRRSDAGQALDCDETKLLQFYETALADLATEPLPPTQSLVDFYYLKQIRQTLDEVLQARLGPLPSFTVVLGTMDAMTIDAGTFLINQNGDRLIVLNAGLLGAISGISNKIAYVAEGSGPFLIRYLRPERIGRARRHFLDLIAKYILNVASEDYAQLPIASGTRDDAYWRHLDSAARIFVVGHEYAHCLLIRLNVGIVGRTAYTSRPS